MKGRHAALSLALAVAAAALLALMAAPSVQPAHAATQVPLTASYSIIGGTGSNVADLLTYVNNGAQQVVSLTGTPTAYQADSGSQWSVQVILNGSTFNERWISSTGSVSGTISAPLTVSFTYYHQYLVTFSYNVTKGGTGYSGPSVSYTALGSASSSAVPNRLWVDASSSYSYDSLLPGSSSTERWVPRASTSGTITAPTSVTVTYNHEYLVSSSYSIVGGGSPSPPVLSSSVLGGALQVTMTTATQTTWFDSGANYSFTGSLTAGGTSSAKEAWPGTVLVQTQSGSALSMVYSGTVTKPVTITPVYWHQFLVNVSYRYVGGSPNGLTAPAVSYFYFGTKDYVNSTAALWVDAGTQYSRPETVCCPSFPSLERWELYNSTTGTISAPTVITSTYFHQYFEAFAFSVAGQQPPAPAGQPSLTYLAGGNAQHLSLLVTDQSAWADANSTYSAASTLPASGPGERWYALFATGSIVGPAPNNSVVVTYSQQYLISVVGSGPPSQWATAGANETAYFPGYFGRSQGAGYRVLSYRVDSGPSVTVTKPALLFSIPVQAGPHTISFQSVVQYQVSLDAGAAGALHSITSTPIPGDDHWYDAGSAVQVVLSGTWGRADGVGQRILSISVAGQSTIQVHTAGTVQAYSTASLLSAVSVATTSTTQYEVALNGAALAAFSSITPPSTLANDTFWYDSGSPAATVVLNGTYARAGGTGLRTTSWELDSGAVTRVATAGLITIKTNAMTSAQFVDATSVIQYQLTLDAGGAAALSTVTGPSVPLDQGWYDSSTPVGLIMNGAWGRASGTGHRLVGYSVNGGIEVPVATTGLVTVLNLPGLISPVAVATTVVAQYQVTLDSGAAAALSTITPTPIPQDKGWFDSGTQVSVTLNSVWGRTSTAGVRLVSYSVNQGASTPVLSSSTVQALSLAAISGPESVATKTVQQYRLISSPVAPASLSSSTLPGDAPGWFDSGTAVKAVYDSVWNVTSSGSRESVTSYAVDGAGRTSVQRSAQGNFTVSVLMNSAHSVLLTSVTQFMVSLEGPPSFTASPPSPTGDSYFDSGSKVTFTVPTSWNGTSGSGMRELLGSYSLDGGPPVQGPPGVADTFATQPVTFTGPHDLVFQTTIQYEVAFEFLDGLGTGQVYPSDVQLGVGNATLDVPGQTAWLANGASFKVLGVIWEGANVGPAPAPSFQLKGAPLNVTLQTQVFSASVKAVDLFGLPVSGARVSMTLANGTTINGTTKSDGTFSAGMIPLGTFTAKVTSLGLTASVAEHFATGPQVAEGRVALSLVSLFVIVAAAAAGASGSVLFLRRRKRKRVSGRK